MFNGKPLGANIVLMSEPDADHAYAPGDWLEKAPPTKPNSNPFPGLDLRGTVIYEWNGDLNIAYHYTVDGIRLAHFADNAHLLTDEQLAEIGHPDIIFISPPKPDATDNTGPLDVVRRNIEALRPKRIIWTHHLAPKDMPKTGDQNQLRPFFVDYFRTHASTCKLYGDEGSFMELCFLLENAYTLNPEYSGIILDDTMLEIDISMLNRDEPPTSILFRAMLSE